MYSPSGAQQRKIPPFKTITKEISNALNRPVYIHTDNRGQPVIYKEEEIDGIINGITSLSILNRFVIQYDLKHISNTPAPINRPTPTGKNLPVDKLRKIKAATPSKENPDTMYNRSEFNRSRPLPEEEI